MLPIEFASAAVVASLYAFACLSFGAFIFQLLAATRRINLVELPLTAYVGGAFILGAGLLSQILELFALAGWYRLPLLLALMILCALPGLWGLRLAARRFWPSIQTEARWFRHVSFLWQVLVVLTLFLLALFAFLTAMPPKPLGDPSAYYLVLPRLIASTGILVRPSQYGAYTQISLQGEYHYAALMLFSGTTAAKMFSWPAAFSAICLMAALAGQVGIRRVGQWVLVVMLLTSTTVTLHIWDGKVDLLSTAAAFAAFYWALRIHSSDRPGATVLTGLFVGLAIDAKLSYAAFMPPTIVLLMVWRDAMDAETRDVRRIVPAVVLVGLWSALMLVPQTIKNQVLFDAPLAPFFVPRGVQTASTRGGIFDDETTQRIVNLYPLSLIFTGTLSGGGITPLYLAFLPLILLVPRARQLLRQPVFQLTAVGVLGVIIWTIARPSAFAARYFMAPALLLTIPGARGADYLFSRPNSGFYVKKAVQVCMLVLLLATISDTLIYTTVLTHIIAAGPTSICDLEDGIEATCRFGHYLDQVIVPGDRVYNFTNYTYWLPISLLQCDWYANPTNQWPGAPLPEMRYVQTYTPPELLWQAFVDNNVTYIIVDTRSIAGAMDYLNPVHKPAWLTTTEILNIDGGILLHLTWDKQAHPPKTMCTQIAPGQWRDVPVASGATGAPA